ncbi:acyl carrier protein [Kitasatospora sp. NPDC057223]|uniref:acyl carrier protein n=1 Tax=Kitasatospora sp. NPDC057223 TaxID=3346055 RepID=UPI00364365A4
MDQIQHDWELSDFENLDDFDDFDELDDFERDDRPVIEVTPPSLAELATAGLAERTRIIEKYVREELARVLGVDPYSIDTTGRPMNSLGVGSIHGLEIQRRMEAVLRIDVNLQRLLRANSAFELIECLAGQLGPEDSPHKRSAGHTHAVPAVVGAA